jgi:hypothetical protein
MHVIRREALDGVLCREVYAVEVVDSPVLLIRIQQRLFDAGEVHRGRAGEIAGSG